MHFELFTVRGTKLLVKENKCVFLYDNWSIKKKTTYEFFHILNPHIDKNATELCDM